MKKRLSTFHSLKRAEERANLNPCQSEKLFEEAYLYGKTADSFRNIKINNYMVRRHRNDAQVKYYNGKIFIFSSDGICITVFDSPGYFNKKYYHKTVVRDTMKFLRMNPLYKYKVELVETIK